MKQPLKPDTRFNRFIGYKRLWFGFCPRCNSDAPLVDTCGTCNRAYDKDGRDVKNTRELYPPTLATKALWLFTWMHPHADAKQDWLESGRKLFKD